MTRSVVFYVLLGVLIITISGPTGIRGVTWASESSEEKELREKKEKEQKKDAERKENQEKTKAKIAREYDKLRTFAEDLYRDDLEYRDEVDDAYLELKSQHALQAYQINTMRTTELVAPETEDVTLQIRRMLYDNPWVQDYVNRVGQQLVPVNSEKLFAFKVTYSPIPYSYTLSTGTVLVSTGLISLLDNETQLAYVLAHELAHAAQDHWKIKVMMPMAQEEYNQRQQKKRKIFGGILGAAGALVGGIAGGRDAAVQGLVIGAGAGYLVGAALNRKIGLDWDTAQEDAADEFAMYTILNHYYDVKEVPKLFALMEQVSRVDERTQLGFVGQRNRIRERREFADRALQGALQAQYQELLSSGKIRGTTPEFNQVMADLKRDNGIEAYQFDMFDMAKRNLQQAVSLRSDDARANFYYGCVLKLVGRTAEDKSNAKRYLEDAIRMDTRHTIPEALLQRALLTMDSPDAASQSVALRALKDYVETYQQRRCSDSTCLPPNLETLYDYMRVLGDKSWQPTMRAGSPPAPAPDKKTFIKTSTPAKKPNQ